MKTDDFITQLEKIFMGFCNELMPNPKSPTEIIAYERLVRLSSAASRHISYLAEPWLGNTFNKTIEETIFECSFLHFYARVLDDAIDINLPVYRKNLLKVQVKFWQVLGSLSCKYGPHWKDATKLINETIEYTIADDEIYHPINWGRKNHHLLLIPMFLSNNSIQYTENKEILSYYLFIIQAFEEYEQHKFLDKTVSVHLLECIIKNKIEDKIIKLSSYGWIRVQSIAIDASKTIIEKIEVLL